MTARHAQVLVFRLLVGASVLACLVAATTTLGAEHAPEAFERRLVLKERTSPPRPRGARLRHVRPAQATQYYPDISRTSGIPQSSERHGVNISSSDTDHSRTVANEISADGGLGHAFRPTRLTHAPTEEIHG